MGTQISNNRDHGTTHKSVNSLNTKEQTEVPKVGSMPVVPGKAKSNRGLVVANFSAIDISEYNNSKLRVEAGKNVMIGSTVTKVAETRALKASKESEYKPELITQTVNNIKVTGASMHSNNPISSYTTLSKQNKESVSKSKVHLSKDTEKSESNTASVIGSTPSVSRGNMTLGVAYFSAGSIGSYNNSKVRVNVSENVKTNSATLKANQMRAEQAILNNISIPKRINSFVMEEKAFFCSELSKYYNKTVPITKTISSEVAFTTRELVGNMQSALNKNSDLATQSVSQVISATQKGYSTIKGAQHVSDGLIKAGVVTTKGTIKTGVVITKGIIKTGKGTWDVATTAGLATVTVARTVQFMRYNFIPLNQGSMNFLRQQALATGLHKTMLSRQIIHGVQRIHNGIGHIKTGLVIAKQTLRNGTNRVCHIINTVATGKLTSKIAYEKLIQARNATLRGIRQGTIVSAKLLGKGARGTVKGVTRGTIKVGMWATFKGAPRLAKASDRDAMRIANMLKRTDDMALQGLGHAINVSRYGTKAATIGTKVAARTVKTSVKAGKTIGKTVSFVKNKGLREAWKRSREKAAQMVAKAGKSMVSTVIHLVKALGRKVLLPIILICVCVLAVSGVITTPVTAVGAIFGSVFGTSDDEKEYDIREYIMDTTTGIPNMRKEYITDFVKYLEDSLEVNGGKYDYVRLYTNQSTDLVACTYEDISAVFYKEEQIANIIQPIFNAVVLMKYDLEPTEAQAKALLQEIFDILFVKKEAPTIEWCGQTDPEVVPDSHTCGSIHALGGCPNEITGTHGSYTCDTCCYETCNGHSDGKGGTTYCSGCTHACSGYRYCGGHDVLTVTLNMDGIYQLLKKYFIDPIEELSNLPSRTEEEEEKLQSLKDYYEICLEYIGQVNIAYGGGMSIEDISGVEWVVSSRKGNKELINFALSQIGQTGGQPYWSYYGFVSRVEWCACFVHYCYNMLGYGDDYGHSSNNAYCPTLVNYHKDRGDWKDSSYQDLAPGDVIFFDWEGDGTSDHVGLVIGRDANNVYTVEGNSGDAVKLRCYPLNSSVILGYAVFND